jgi:ketosteroid isomerase-like protein
MSGSNEERVRAVLDGWNERDLDRMLELCATDVQYVNSPDAVEPGTRHGHDGFAGVLRKQWDLLGEDAHNEVQELHVVDEKTFVTVSVITRTMPGSDAKIEARGAMRWTCGDDGLITRIEVLGAGSSFDRGLDEALGSP